MSDVLPQNDVDDPAGGFFETAGFVDGEPDGDADADLSTGGGVEDAEGPPDATIGSATGAACGVREEGAHAATRVTTDIAAMLSTR